MTLIKRTNFKATKKAISPLVQPTCRRCGAACCICSEEDIDAGGPA